MLASPRSSPRDPGTVTHDLLSPVESPAVGNLLFCVVGESGPRSRLRVEGPQKLLSRLPPVLRGPWQPPVVRSSPRVSAEHRLSGSGERGAGPGAPLSASMWELSWFV